MYRFTFVYLHITFSSRTGQPPLMQKVLRQMERGMNGGHKQVKLHGLLISLIDSLEDAIDCPKRGHKKRKRPQRIIYSN